MDPMAKELVMEAARQHFRPELLNRMDDIVVFEPLTRENLHGVVCYLLCVRVFPCFALVTHKENGGGADVALTMAPSWRCCCAHDKRFRSHKYSLLRLYAWCAPS